MEIKHPEMEYVPVKVKKAKLDPLGGIIYVEEVRRIPRVVLEAMGHETEAEAETIEVKK